MKRLHEKLHSQSGASILMALLLFLICSMVAASILAAAVSNAGKVRSSRVEQQKQLTLSSAIELVCGQLEKTTYTGRYEVCEWTQEVGSYIYTDADGNEQEVAVYEDFFHCRQTAGDFSCGALTSLLPLGKELDAMFGEQFRGAGYEALSGENIVTSAVDHSLKVSLPADLDGYPYPKDPDNPTVYEVPDEVTVRVTLSHDTRHITVTAWLGGGDTPPADGSDTMSAELMAVGVPSLDYNPAGRSAASSSPESGTGKTTNTVKWELNWIRKGAA